MSYCRFAEGYVYAYVCDGGVQFYVSDGKRELDRLCNTFNEAYQYAKALRDTHGLDVPSNAIEALKADALEEAARICGPDSAVAELEAENDKLRVELTDLRLKSCPSCGIKVENEKLRDQLEEQKCFAADLMRDIRELRELVLDMWPHVRHRSRMCGECELPCDTSDECLLYEPMRQRMRELGIGVKQ